MITADAVTGITLNGGGGTVIEEMILSHPLTGPRSPSLIGMTLNFCNFSQVDKSRIEGFSTNLQVRDGMYWSILNSSFRDFVQIGLSYDNMNANGDAGDGTIQNCTFDRGSDTVVGGTCVEWTSGGGMRFENNKINGRPGGFGFEHGVRLLPKPGIATGVCLIANNSIENFRGYGVSVEPGGFWNTLLINGNEISGFNDASCISTAIYLNCGPTGVTITGNHIYSVDNGIDVNNVKQVAIAGNSLSNIKTTGIKVRTHARDVHISPQPIQMNADGKSIVYEGTGEGTSSFETRLRNPEVMNTTPVGMFEIELANTYAHAILEVEVTGSIQNIGGFYAKQVRLITRTTRDASVATVGTDLNTATMALGYVVTGLGGVVRLTFAMPSGGGSMTSQCHVNVSGAGFASYKQLVTGI